MQFSNKIIKRQQNPVFTGSFESSHKLDLKLFHNKSQISIYFDVIQINNEFCFKKVQYKTDLKSEYLGILDAFVELMHTRPIEAIDRFPVKELDFFLRDTNSKSSLSGFDEKFYEVLGLGEELKKSFFKISKDHSPKLSYPFSKMSVSEQLDFIEELCSHYIYPHEEELLSLEVIDITEDTIIFSSNSKSNNLAKVEKIVLESIRPEIYKIKFLID